MINLGKDEMAKYPFLDAAGEYLKSQGFTLEQFGTDADLKPFLDKAWDRIYSDVKLGIPFKSKISNGEADEPTLQTEIFSFLLAVILLKLASARHSSYHFSMQESRRAQQFLEKDLGARERKSIDEKTFVDSEMKTKRQIAAYIIKTISNTSIESPKEVNEIEDYDQWLISVSDYLPRAVQLHAKHWKLVNRYVTNGKVYLSSHEVVRTIRAELDHYIKNKISSMPTPKMMPMFKDPVKKIIELEKEMTPRSTIISTEYPPCIKHAIEVLEKGENLSHSGRFMLGTFLLGKGQSIEQIAPLFKNAPDYNEKVTLYQLSHLAGESGSGTKYFCPSCEKLKTQDLCYIIPECDGIINPFQFGNKKTLNA